jgi:hypothetical protein
MSESAETSKTVSSGKPAMGSVSHAAMLERISKRWSKTLAHLAKFDRRISDEKRRP